MPHRLATRFGKEINFLLSLPELIFLDLVAKLDTTVQYELFPEETIEAIVEETLSEFLANSEIEAGDFTSFLVSFYLFYSEHHYTIDDFLELISKALNLDSPDSVLDKRLRALISLTKILVSVKATSLHGRSVEHSLLASKHVCDIRPIFVNRHQEFEHALLQQIIVLTVKDSNGDIKTISIAIDQKQLDKLTDDLIDARVKKDAIVAHCRNSKTYLIVDDDK